MLLSVLCWRNGVYTNVSWCCLREFCLPVVASTTSLHSIHCSNVRMFTCSPAEERCGRYDSRHGPRQDRHEATRTVSRHPVRMRVGNIASDEPIAIESNGSNVQNRRRAAEHVCRCPEVAQNLTELPFTTDYFLYNITTTVFSVRSGSEQNNTTASSVTMTYKTSIPE